jgi:hypothetical protein
MAPGTRLVHADRAGPPFAVGVLAVLGTLPVVRDADPVTGAPQWLLVMVVIGVGVVAVGASTALGSLLSGDVGLRTLAPDRLPGEGINAYRLPVAAGVGVAVVALGVHAGASTLGVDPGPLDRWAAPDWPGLVASVAGGVVTELVFRYGFMTLVVWTAWTYRPGVDRGVTRASVWAGILAAALLGGCAAIPAAVVDGVDPVVVAVAAVVPLVGGVVFGLLYWRYDLAAAVIAHSVASLLRALAAMLPF